MSDCANSGFTLVLGGAASGKSAYAQHLAEQHAGPLLYVATAASGDAEMAERIMRHQEQRGLRWQTLEEPLDLAGCLPDAVLGKSAVLIDCATLWVTNLLFAHREDAAQVWPAVEAFIAVLQTIQVPIYMVSNELGSGLVPEHPLGRQFRDLAGQVNQRLAASADRVWLVTAGLPLQLK